jgi:hypothetical protein
VAVFALIVVLIILIVGFGYLLMRRGAGAEGANVDLAFESEVTFDEDFREAAAAATPPAIAHTKPEPGGAPPMAGAQWDEVAGGWIRWDEATKGWVPVEDA